MLFDNPVSHVCFSLGDLDPNSPTLIEAFAADGTSLGTVGNLDPGTNQYSIGDGSGENVISGVSIYIPDDGYGMDWEGFAVSDLSLNVGVVPEPGTWSSGHFWAWPHSRPPTAPLDVRRRRNRYGCVDWHCDATTHAAATLCSDSVSMRNFAD